MRKQRSLPHGSHLGMRKHRFLPHGSHFGKQKHRNLPHGSHFATQNGHLGRQCVRNGRFGLSWCCQCAQKGCSGLDRRCQCAQNRHSVLLWCRQCAHKACSSPLQCTECAQRGCSSMLFEITIRKCWSRLHSALSHYTLLHFAPCMDMRDAVRACCPRSLFESAGLGFTLL